MRTYSSVNASLDTRAIGTIFKIITILTLVVIAVIVGAMYYLYNIVSPTTLIIVLIPPNIYSLLQIIGYSKRDIIKLTNPSGLEKTTTILKAVFSRPIEMIIIPTFTVFITSIVIATTVGFTMSTLSIMAVIIYGVQILPLSVKRDVYMRSAHQAINDAHAEIKTARIIIGIAERGTFEYKHAMSRHIAAEEMSTVNSDFLVLSTSLTASLIMILRGCVPFVTTTAGFVVNILAGG